MKDTLEQDAQMEPKEGRKALPSSRALTQTVPGNDEVKDSGRLMQEISIGKKPEVYMVKPQEVESLRPSPEEMKNG